VKHNVSPFGQRTETVVTAHVSLVIAIVLMLQLVATFNLFPLFLSRPSHLLWPFMDYPMYRSARYEGSLMEWYRVLGRRADGSEIEVTPDDVGLNVRRFRDVLIAAIRGADMPRVRGRLCGNLPRQDRDTARRNPPRAAGLHPHAGGSATGADYPVG
jgi:hypothetical protein